MNSHKKKTRAIILTAIVTLLANYAISSTVTMSSSNIQVPNGTQEVRSGSGVKTTTPRPSRSGSGVKTTTPRPSRSGSGVKTTTPRPSLN